MVSIPVGVKQTLRSYLENAAGEVDANFKSVTRGGKGPFEGQFASTGDYVPAAPAANGGAATTIADVDGYSTEGILSDDDRGIVLTDMPTQAGIEDVYYIAWACSVTTDTDGVTVTVRARDDTHGTAIANTEESTTVDISESPKVLTHIPDGTVAQYDPDSSFQFNFDAYSDNGAATVQMSGNAAMFPLGRVA